MIDTSLHQNAKMSWLVNFFNCTYPCNWRCCEQNELSKTNTAKFWQAMKCDDTSKLLREKNIYLCDTYGTVLTLGINMHNEFKFCARLEVKSTNDVIAMNANNLNCFLECLNQHFNENIVLPQPSTSDTDNESCVQLSQIQQRIFKLRIGDRNLKIDEKSLQTLFRIKSHIKMYILMLEYERKPYEALFFKLLNHFCYGKTVKEVTELANLIHTQRFFDEIISFHCDCIDKFFVLEIATNFSEWFTQCAPMFIKIQMFIESMRLQTFSNSWPHEELIDVNKMAKTGLFYTGTADIVECAFCKLKLYGWDSSDDAVEDHYNYSPSCAFLRNPHVTQNVADIDGEKEMIELLKNLKDEGYDEPDFAII